MKELERQASPDIIMVLAGHIFNEPLREVEEEEAKAWAAEKGLIFFETSAKTGMNVTEIFETIGIRLFDRMLLIFVLILLFL